MSSSSEWETESSEEDSSEEELSSVDEERLQVIESVRQQADARRRAVEQRRLKLRRRRQRLARSNSVHKPRHARDRVDRDGHQRKLSVVTAPADTGRVPEVVEAWDRGPMSPGIVGLTEDGRVVGWDEDKDGPFPEELGEEYTNIWHEAVTSPDPATAADADDDDDESGDQAKDDGQETASRDEGKDGGQGAASHDEGKDGGQGAASRGRPGPGSQSSAVSRSSPDGGGGKMLRSVSDAGVGHERAPHGKEGAGKRSTSVHLPASAGQLPAPHSAASPPPKGIAGRVRAFGQRRTRADATPATPRPRGSRSDAGAQAAARGPAVPRPVPVQVQTMDVGCLPEAPTGGGGSTRSRRATRASPAARSRASPLARRRTGASPTARARGRGGGNVSRSPVSMVDGAPGMEQALALDGDGGAGDAGGREGGVGADTGIGGGSSGGRAKRAVSPIRMVPHTTSVASLGALAAAVVGGASTSVLDILATYSDHSPPYPSPQPHRRGFESASAADGTPGGGRGVRGDKLSQQQAAKLDGHDVRAASVAGAKLVLGAAAESTIAEGLVGFNAISLIQDSSPQSRVEVPAAPSMPVRRAPNAVTSHKRGGERGRVRRARDKRKQRAKPRTVPVAQVVIPFGGPSAVNSEPPATSAAAAAQRAAATGDGPPTGTRAAGVRGWGRMDPGQDPAQPPMWSSSKKPAAGASNSRAAARQAAATAAAAAALHAQLEAEATAEGAGQAPGRAATLREWLDGMQMDQRAPPGASTVAPMLGGEGQAVAESRLRKPQARDRGADRTSARYVFGRPLMMDSKVRRQKRRSSGGGSNGHSPAFAGGGPDATGSADAAGLPSLKRGSADATSGNGALDKAGAAGAVAGAAAEAPVPQPRPTNGKRAFRFEGVAPAMTLDSSPIRNMADVSRPVIGTTGANMATISMGADLSATASPARRRAAVAARRSGSQRALNGGASSSVAVTLSLARQAARKGGGGGLALSGSSRAPFVRSHSSSVYA